MENKMKLKSLLSKKRKTSIKEGSEEKNYMFFQNLKTIHHDVGEFVKMDKTQLDKLLNDHDWAKDHIATSADDVEEVYHFIEAQNKNA